ncbi:hypothetical protein L6452_05920 [Arctium lappa]|uniref:Uncharacterized protein n=1 Tax=Arctium lappa TaxID=4217 RepID=A0ACB9EI67_ARCLA|nr:hypothetical protein L6452_05920 [Arctium lappa]
MGLLNRQLARNQPASRLLFGSSSAKEVANRWIGDKTIGSLLLVAFQTRHDAAKSSTAAFRNWRMGGPRFQKASALGRKRKPVEETMMTIDEGGCDEHQEEYENQRKELMKAKREVEMMKNERKSKECEEALKSLRELQNKLMRKSMHVGSLERRRRVTCERRGDSEVEEKRRRREGEILRAARLSGGLPRRRGRREF